VGWPNSTNVVLMSLATFATLASGLDYLVAAVRARRASRG
jgi:hypothetical protein